MSIFNSLGSNYSRESVVFSLQRAKNRHRDELIDILSRRYKSDEIYLSYKGREALAFVLKSLELPQNSLVTICGFTCYAVYQSVVAAGHKPYYLDIEKNQLNFTPEKLEKALKDNPDIKAVVIQNTMGLPCDIESIKSICDKHEAVLVEDLAQCIGLKYAKDKEAGSVGVAAALSFGQDKVVDAVSGGAAILRKTAPYEFEYRSASLVHRFKTRLYPFIAVLVRKTTSIGIGKILLKMLRIAKILPGPMSGNADTMHKLPAWHSRNAIEGFDNLKKSLLRRRNIADIYRALLSPKVQIKHFDNANYLRFPILVEDPADLVEFLKKHQIYVGDRWYDAPVSPIRTLDLTDYEYGQCPNAEYVAARIINLPTHVNINNTQARMLAERINEWLKLQSKR